MDKRQVGQITVLVLGTRLLGRFNPVNTLLFDYEVGPLRQELQRIRDHTRQSIIIDMGRIGDIGQKGVACLVDARQEFQRQGRQVKICGIRMKFPISDFHFMFPLVESFETIYPNQERAIASFAAGRPW